MTGTRNDTIIKMLGGAVVAIGGLFLGAGLNGEGSNNGLWVAIGVVLVALGAAEYIRQWRTGMFAPMSNLAIGAMSVVMVAIVIYLAGDNRYLTTFIALGLLLVALAMYLVDKRATAEDPIKNSVSPSSS